MSTTRTLTVALLVLVGLAAIAIVIIVLLLIERGNTMAQFQNVREDLHATQQELSSEVDRGNTLTLRVNDLTENLANADARNQELLAENANLGMALKDAVEQGKRLASDKSVLEDAVSASNVRNEGLAKDLEAEKGLSSQLTQNLDEVNVKVANLTVDNRQLGAELEGAQSHSQQLELDLEEAEAHADELAADKTRLESDLQGVRDLYAQTSGDLEEIRTNYATLEQQAGTLENLNARAESLRKEIQDLEAQRRPLILDSRINGFACTGSMEPRITCLDEATWLYNWKPNDIVIGSTISFEPTEECDLDSDRVAHRVTDIKIEDSIHYYWPKGDASDEPDGCWIPQANVNGYIIDIHKNVRPENAGLRDHVNAATAAREAVGDLLNQASSKLDEARDAYSTRFELYCRFHPDDADQYPQCTLPTGQYNAITRLWDEWNAAYDQYQAAFNQYVNASEFENCWVDSARNALYREGQSPLYAPCVSSTTMPSA